MTTTSSRRQVMHIDMTALTAMQAYRDVDDDNADADDADAVAHDAGDVGDVDDACSSPIYPFDSGVDDTCTSDFETNDDSVKSTQNVSATAAPNGFRNDATFGGFSHAHQHVSQASNSTLATPYRKPQRPAKAKQISLDLKSRPIKGFLANRLNGSKKRNRAKLMSDVTANVTQRSSVCNSEGNSQRSDANTEKNDTARPKQKKSLDSNRKTQLQWMDFKTTGRGNDEQNTQRTNEKAENESLRDAAKPKLPNVDRSAYDENWSDVQRQTSQRGACHKSNSKRGEPDLKSILSSNRFDWRLLHQLKGQSTPHSDGFSIYSWSMRKHLYEANPLTAYVKEATTLEASVLRARMGRAQKNFDTTTHGRRSEASRQSQDSARVSRSQSGPTGGKLARFPGGGYNFKKEKTKTPGEMAIDDARVKNAGLAHGASVETAMNGAADAVSAAATAHARGAGTANTVNSNTRESTALQLPNIHLSRAVSDNLFRRFVPGKTIASQPCNQSLQLLYSPPASERSVRIGQCPFLVKPFTSLPQTVFNPALTSYQRPPATRGTVKTSVDTALPLLHLTNGNLVNSDSPVNLESTLNAQALVPLPRATDVIQQQLQQEQAQQKQEHMLALTYQSGRYGLATPPKPPPATPASVHAFNRRLANVDAFSYGDQLMKHAAHSPAQQQMSRSASRLTWLSSRRNLVSRNATFVTTDDERSDVNDAASCCSDDDDDDDARSISSLSSVDDVT